MLARLECVRDHGEVQGVRRAHMDHIHFRIVQNLTIVAGGLADVQFFAQLAGLLLAAFADGVDFDVAKTANSFQVHAAHEACAENRGFQFANHNCLSSEASNLTQMLIEWYEDVGSHPLWKRSESGSQTAQEPAGGHGLRL